MHPSWFSTCYKLVTNFIIKVNLLKSNVFIKEGKVIYKFGGLVMAVDGVNNVQRQVVNPAQYYANNYATQAINSDESLMGITPIGGAAYMNNYSDIYGGMNPGGLGFGGMMPGMGTGIMPGMGTGMMGYGPGSEVMGMTQEQYLKYQEKMENYQIDKQVRQQKKLANAEFSATAAEDSITRQIGILQRKIKNNEQDSVFAEYNKLLNAVEVKLREGGYISGKVDKNQVKAHAEKLYFEATGKNITNDLAENGDSSFVHGLKQGAFGFGFLLSNNKNYKDNVSAITGEAKDKSSSAWQAVGTAVSGLLTGGLALFAVAKGIKGIKARP